MEDQVIPKLAESGTAFALLGFVVWSMVGLLKMLVDANIQMGRQLASTNADLSSALRESEKGRIEAQQSHQEQLLLLKVMAQRLEEK